MQWNSIRLQFRFFSWCDLTFPIGLFLDAMWWSPMQIFFFLMWRSPKNVLMWWNCPNDLMQMQCVFLMWCSFHEIFLIAFLISFLWCFSEAVEVTWSRPIDRCPDFVFQMMQWMRPGIFLMLWRSIVFFWWCQPLARCSDLVLKFGWCPKDFLMPENFSEPRNFFLMPEKIFWCEFDFILLILI